MTGPGKVTGRGWLGHLGNRGRVYEYVTLPRVYKYTIYSTPYEYERVADNIANGAVVCVYIPLTLLARSAYHWKCDPLRHLLRQIFKIQTDAVVHLLHLVLAG